MLERKTTRIAIKYGKFVLVYEQVIEKEPVKQIEELKLKQLTTGGVDTYA